ncbi:PREDICTED: uncharacterized protein LOC108364785 [Rhagoletis zephyria]|uniref:uncharacterized protein LOC108364785 n=1 Tax=Rhagoletis zephyria TaxID=28612 RepID=UPI0008116DFA|nr:PREDICTED: uncharacterized protein LOC108364785 [Rhagoletis zephyria]
MVTDGEGSREHPPPQNFAPRIPMPAMSGDNIDAYFYSLDFWFEATGIIADTAKFNIVLASVPPAKLMELRAIIDAAPAMQKYQYIRTKLSENFAESQQRRLQRVLRDMPLGDRRPSDLFNEMKRAAGTTLSDSILHDLWLSRLPPYAQAAIIATNVPTVDKLKIADSICESFQLREGQVHEVSNPPHTSEADLRAEVAALRQRFDEVANGRKVRRPRSRTPARNRDASSGGASDLCWYHSKFGRNARKCRQPCKYGQPTANNAQ